MAYAQHVESKQMGAREKDKRAVYLVVHSDILRIVKDNDNKQQWFESVVEYNSHHSDIGFLHKVSLEKEYGSMPVYTDAYVHIDDELEVFFIADRERKHLMWKRWLNLQQSR